MFVLRLPSPRILCRRTLVFPALACRALTWHRFAAGVVNVYESVLVRRFQVGHADPGWGVQVYVCIARVLHGSGRPRVN
jgi:hypothetical protein